MVADLPKLTSQTLAEKILLASAQGDFDGIITLLDQNPGVTLSGCPDAKNQNGNTALMEAVSHGREAVVERLIAAGADIDAQSDLWKATALMMAVENGHKTIVDSLLEARAKVDLKDKSDNTALMYAAKNGDVAILGRLLAAGATVDLQDKNGCTALCWAAYHERDGILPPLLAAGANPWVQSRRGNLPLHQVIAQKRDHPEKAHPAARILVPAMFDVRWWTGKSPAQIESAWKKIPAEWHECGASAIAKLSRHFTDKSSPAACVNRRLPSPTP